MTNETALVEVQGNPRRASSRVRREDRLPQLIGLQVDANEVLDNLTVMLIGVGSVGATVALSLAHLHVAELRLLDRRRFTEASTLTQPVGQADVGKPKASAIGRRCKDISPRTRVLVFDGPFQELPLADMMGVDVVVLAGDNATLEWDTGQRCLNLGVPLIHASVHGESMTALCRVFSFRNPEGPCPVCLFGRDEFRMLDEERTWSCEGFRRANGPQSQALQSTNSLRPLCALAGEVAALAVVRMALKLGLPIGDTLTEINACTWRTFVTPITRKASCPCRHERFTIRTRHQPLAHGTLASLLRSTTRSGNRDRGAPSFVVEGYRWVERGTCCCAEFHTVNRFIPVQNATVSRCRRCHGPIQPQPFYTHDVVPAKLLGDALDRPLRALGATPCRGILVHRGDHTILVTNPDPKARL
jgi:molybdopterin/thiamine biosynthesis adenylyltransferase